ncbi:hypothetical protein Scep_012773 [Stephania cephalantha]|uniref:non-specific serine/threonine protein kinase n=1 Tax=Stephania cephalantha TaxID=152367 RepID=A0AAP0JHS4_9MAGN
MSSTTTLLLPLLLSSIFIKSTHQSPCTRGCHVSLASYFIWEGSNLTYISRLFSTPIPKILPYNPNIPNPDTIQSGTRVNIPFSCYCINGDFLGHVFAYTTLHSDTYERIARNAFSNLTTPEWVQRVNRYKSTQIPDFANINVTINCSCGDTRISRDYGLFETYPIREGESLSRVSAETGLPADLLRMYNPGSNFSFGSGPVFVPARDENGKFPPLRSSTGGLSAGAIAGISVGAFVAAALLVVICLCFWRLLRAKPSAIELGPVTVSGHQSVQHGEGSGSGFKKIDHETAGFGGSPGLTGITMDKSVEFSYEELAKATNDFNDSNRIGQGGFGAVYYAELRGEKAAIKKMDMQASKEFLAELKVLTHVHHLNLVRLIGYCVEGSLFLVYEYIENGNLSQHLRNPGMEPLPWSTRVQIALDSARGLEYIHEHTVPVYIHRDIKSANILIDKNFHGKVADFGLTKLTEVGSTSLPTRLVGTFGYMPPEYAQYGDVSPKVDVYAFGVVLYELISAKEAIVKKNKSMAESKGLITLFDEVLNKPNPEECLRTLVDPTLGSTYPLDSVHKMAQVAKACTHDNPQLRPTMRSIVVALMTLSSTNEDWDVGSFYDNQALVKLMTGR